MQQILGLSALAGLASAFLFGVLTPGSAVLAPLMFVAPAPLMIVGIGWHPLVAALGALIGCIAISFAVGSKAALSFGVLIGLPAYLVAAGILWLLRPMPSSTTPREAGRVFAVYVLGGIAAYAAMAVLGGALAVSLDYTVFETRLAGTFQHMMQEFSGSKGSDAAATARMAQLFVRIFVPLSTIIVATSLIVSLWLAFRFLAKMERLPFRALPAYTINFSKDMLFWLAGAIALAQVSGFAGLFGASFAGALLLLLLLNGLAFIHTKTIGSAMRGGMLWATWILLLVFAPAALIYSFIGLLDALFDFRRNGGSSNPQT